MPQTIVAGATGDQIGAKQDVGTDVNFDVNGMRVTNSSGAAAGGYRNQGALSTTAAAIGGPPSAGETISIGSMKLTNTGASIRTVTLYATENSATFNSTTQWGTPIILNPAESAEWTSTGWVIYDSNGIPKFSSATFPRLIEGVAPGTPPAGSIYFWAGNDSKIKQTDDQGIIGILNEDGRHANYVINGEFDYCQRQAPAATTYSNTSGRAYGADRFGVTNENASVTYTRVDTQGAPETNHGPRFYGRYDKITALGKVVVSQVLESGNCLHLRGRTVRLQMKLKANASLTFRIALLQLTAAGTVDTLPATFISAFGANGTDPTLGTNLAKIAPVTGTTDNATIVNSGLDCAVTTAWQRFGATFLLPTDFKNLVVVVFGNAQIATTDDFEVGEVGLYDGGEIREWSPRPQAEQLMNCLRYYCKSFPLDSAPIQNFTIAAGGHVGAGAGIAGAVAARHFGIRFPVPMFKTPAIVLFNPAAANAFLRQTVTPSDATATSATSINQTGFDVTATGVAAWTPGDAVAIHFTADAEL